tara:strand:+ start:357 stop:773 length:417 start_codon:yes stop_codon:yes gene_type:complete
MKYILLILYFLTSLSFASDSHNKNHDKHDKDHKQNKIEFSIDGQKSNIDKSIINEISNEVKNGQIALVNVKGMVCDFCARGISKTFKKDKNVKKVSVDLKNGKVYIAYDDDKKIEFEDIKKKMLENGIDAVDMKIFKI